LGDAQGWRIDELRDGAVGKHDRQDGLSLLFVNRRYEFLWLADSRGRLSRLRGAAGRRVCQEWSTVVATASHGSYGCGDGEQTYGTLHVILTPGSARMFGIAIAPGRFGPLGPDALA
jgi:hypothetical protein